VSALQGPNHALLAGQIAGLLLQAGWEIAPVIEGDCYTDQILVRRPSGAWLITVTPHDVTEL
jgi:hypothetical protein